MLILRNNHQRCSMKKGIVRNFGKCAGKHLCQSFFFNKFAGLRLPTLLKKRLWHRRYLVNFVKLLRTPFLQNTSRLLLLNAKNSLIKSTPWKKILLTKKTVYISNNIRFAKQQIEVYENPVRNITNLKIALPVSFQSKVPWTKINYYLFNWVLFKNQRWKA